MEPIYDDRKFRHVIADLDFDRQRALAVLFLNSVADLAIRSELKDAIATVVAHDASTVRRRDAYRNARTALVETYTFCGRDADWLIQAEHFVAAACVLVLSPDETVQNWSSLAWKVAMHARTARNCAMIEKESAEEVSEAQRQYELASKFSG